LHEPKNYGMRMMKNLLMAGLVLLGGVVRGQDGSLDMSFNPTDIGYRNGDGAWGSNDPVRSIALQPDSKVIFVGAHAYNGTTTSTLITRVNANGTLDSTFVLSGTGFAGWTIGDCIVQPDGKIIVGGQFVAYNGTSRNRIARLNADGSLDMGFDPGTGAGGNNSTQVMATELQSDGKVIIGGNFTTFNGISRNRIARLNSDGSLDATFSPGTGANADVLCISIQPDGKVIIGGSFTSYNGTGRNRIARLNADGSLDTGFNPGTGANGSTIRSIAVQADGKIIVGGDFTSYNGVGRNNIARLNADGSLDLGFDPGTGSNARVNSITLQPDGKVIIGGEFTSYNGITRQKLARLNITGSLDLTFGPVPVSANFISFGIRCTALQPDGRILIGGLFTACGGSPRYGIARMNSNGSLDPTFAHGGGHGANGGYISKLIIQPDGKVLIGGSFTSYNGTLRNGIARLNSDGSLDTSFDPGSGLFHDDLTATAAFIRTMTLQPDGKLVIAGSFTSYNGTARSRLARINSDGSLDTGFNPGVGANLPILCLTLQPDGKILIGGDFTEYAGTARNGIARINATGTLDPTFNPGTGVVGSVSCIVLASGILIGGSFSSYNGLPCNNLALVSSDGQQADPWFSSGGGPDGSVSSIVVRSDGKIIIGGGFWYYNGVARRQVAMIDGWGLLVSSWNPNTFFNGGGVFCMALQADGKVIVGGNLGPNNPSNIARFTAFGGQDGFPFSGANYDVRSIALQPDGKFLAAGDFTSYNGTGRNRIARMNNTVGSIIRVFLEGPYSNGLMNDGLRTLPSFPLTEPFTAMGYANAAYTAGATMPASVLATTGNNAIVDWVLVEMRPASAPGTIAAARAALLQRDGDVVALDGTGPVTFPGLANGNYCVAVRPRNHLPVMLATTTPVNYTGNAYPVDFTLTGTQVYDADARKNVNGVMVLAAGDVTFNGTVSYVGSGNDRDPILLRVGGGTPTNTASGYWREDTNLDGVVKYIGAANDRDIILQSIGGIVPSSTRVAGLP
jgi:uncharacterized delta-60 repeat protein